MLEIGCGHGVAAGMICQRLGQGHLVAMDRSQKMIEAAALRNAAHAKAGKAEFVCGDFENLDWGPRRFDKILAVRVGLFWREPERARGIARRWLAPGGGLFVEYDEPPG